MLRRVPKDMSEVVRRLLPEVSELARTSSAVHTRDDERVRWLEANWQKVTTAAFGQLDAELDRVRERAAGTGLLEVLATEVDLLSPLQQELREVAHTQALAFFLSPAASHGLGGMPLASLLRHLSRRARLNKGQEGLADKLDQAQAQANGAYVEPELPYEMEGSEDRGRTDLWIEVPRGAPELLLVIENKLSMTATAAQLARYEKVIGERATRLGLGKDSVAKVLLSYAYSSPQPGWLTTRWVNVAAALAPASVGEADGARLLRYYLATHLRKLEHLTGRPLVRREAMQLLSFLQNALRDLV